MRGPDPVKGLRDTVSRLARARHDYGAVNLALLVVDRGLSLLPSCGLERRYLVAQPVPDEVDARRGKAIAVRRVEPGDAALAQMDRDRDEIADRFD